MNKNSFIIYHDYFEILSDLSDEDLGKLFRALFNYEIERQEPDFNGSLGIAFKFIKKDLDRNLIKYKNICERNTNNGKKGGAPKGNQNAKKKDETTQNNPKQPKTTLYDNDNDNDNKRENTKENKYYIESEINTTTTTLKQLKTIFPDLIEDEPLNALIDCELLMNNIKESSFLKSFKFMKVSWINKNYGNIIAQYYKDFLNKKDTHGYHQRQYTEEELKSIFTDLNEINLQNTN